MAKVDLQSYIDEQAKWVRALIEKGIASNEEQARQLYEAANGILGHLKELTDEAAEELKKKMAEVGTTAKPDKP
jgi:hypothetical protein